MLRILRLNNEAVHYLQHAPAYPSDALAKLEEALRSIQSILEQQDDDDEGLLGHAATVDGNLWNAPDSNLALIDDASSSSTSPRTTTTMSRLTPLGPVHSVALDADFFSGYSETVSSHHDWCVYGRALILTPQLQPLVEQEQEQEEPQDQDDDWHQRQHQHHHQQQPPTISDNDQVRVWGVILYNLGLTYHFLGLQHPQNHRQSRLWLEKALRVYNMVPNTAHPSADDDDRYYLVSLAVRNNMGSIHSQFFHRDEVICCRNILRGLLSTSALDHLTQVEYMFFGVNALFLDASEFNQAPAA